MARLIRSFKAALSTSKNCQSSFSHFNVNICRIQNITSQRVYSQDVTIKSNLRPDVVLRSIKSSINTGELLESLRSYTGRMNIKHITEALKTLFTLQKEGNSSLTELEVLKDRNFINLCKELKRHIRELEINDVVDCVKILKYFQVPVSSIIMQNLLQLIKNDINNMSLQHLTFTSLLLKDFKDDPLCDALKIALPLILETQLRSRLDKTNVNSIVDVLSFCSRSHVSEDCIEYTVKCLLDIDPLDWKIMDVKKIRSIIWSLCSFNITTPSHEQLFQKTIYALIDDISSYNYFDLQTILSLMAKKIRKNPNFYNGEYCDECARLLIKNSCSIDECTMVLRQFNIMAHVNIPLLDYLGRKISEDPKLLRNAPFGIVFTFLDSIVNADYKTDYWESIHDVIANNKQLFKEERENLPWMKFALLLAYCDIYHDSLIRKLFSEKFLSVYLSRDYNIIDHLQMLGLYQAVVTLHPSYKGSLPPENILNKVKDIVGENVQDTPLKAALEAGLGGADYVQTRIFTKLGHFIDHAVVMTKDGLPVPVKTEGMEKVYVEDLNHPDGSQIILILCASPKHHSVNIKRLRGLKVLETRILEALGYTVVSVNVETWTNMPDFEKIPYLMQLIKGKDENDESQEIFSQVT